MPIRRGLSSTGVRLAVVQTAIMVGAFAVAGSMARLVTQHVLRRDAETHVAAEAATLADEYAAGGPDQLAASIAVRSRRKDGVFYRLGQADGRRLAGNLPIAPLIMGPSYIDGDGGPPSTNPILNQDIVVFSRRLPNHDVVSVGEAMGARELMRAALLRGLFWCGLIAAAGGLGASLLVYGGVVRRMDGVVGAARAAARGQLDSRAPVRDGLMRDDIDDLADVFNHMLGQIGTLMQNIRQVSADIAHDLRTPLTRVLHKLDRLRRARADDAGLGADIGEIDADIAETLRAFDTMLRLAEIESTQAGRMDPVDLAALATQVIEAYRPDAEEGGYGLRAALGPATATGDGPLLTHAMANLLDNALRHTPVGTRIVVSTGEENGRAFVSVADNGPGVPESQRTAVLDRFVRLESSRTTAGSGLGLAIVAAIAGRHGATLELLDAGPGLQVRLVFPSSASTSRRPSFAVIKGDCE